MDIKKRIDELMELQQYGPGLSYKQKQELKRLLDMWEGKK